MTADLLRVIYEACLEPERWDVAIKQIAEAVGAHGGHLLLWDERSAGALYSRHVGGASPHADRLYAEYYGAIDPRRRYVMTRPVGEWIGCHQVCDDQFVARSEFYQDYMIPTVGCRYMTGVRLAAEDGRHALLALGRRPGNGAKPFEEADLGPIRALTPHLVLAARLHSRLSWLQARSRLQDEALDHLSMAVVVVDRDGATQYSNRAAEALLADPAGPLASVSGRLAARSGRHACRFDTLVRAAADRGEGGALSLPSPSGKKASHCIFLPLSPDGKWGGAWVRPMTMILLADAQAGCRVDPEVLQALFRLTPSEARLAAALASGMTLEAVAGATGISVFTARAHLRAVFSKIGVNRQAELVAVMERLAQLKPGD